jgi:hypothetical protein
MEKWKNGGAWYFLNFNVSSLLVGPQLKKLIQNHENCKRDKKGHFLPSILPTCWKK